MALKKRVSSLKDVPAQFQDLYKKEGAGFVLDLEQDEADEGEPEGEPEGGGDKAVMAKKLREFRQENIRVRKELEKAQAELSKFDPEAYEAAMKAAESARNEEERQLLQKGRFDEVMNRRLKQLQDERQKIEAQYKEQLDSAGREAHVLRTKLHKDRVRTMLREAADQMKIQLLPTASADFYARGLNVFNGIDDEGEPVALDGDDIRFNKDQQPYGPKDFLMELIETAPHLLSGATGGAEGGGPPRRGARPAGVLDIDINDTKAMGDNIEKIATGKIGVRVAGLGS